MIRLPYLLLLLVGVNLLTAGILHGWVYDALDKYRYEQDELLLQKALVDSRKALKSVNPEQWRPIVDELGVRFTTGSELHTRDSKELPSRVLELISDSIASEGVVDPIKPMVYYPLGDNHVFVLGPLSLKPWQLYLIEWVTLLAAVLAGTFIVLLYYGTFQKHTHRIYQALSQMRTGKRSGSLHHNDVGTLEHIYELIEVVKKEQEELHHSNHMHIQSQRDLLHGVAHEFRSPMARMQFALEMITQGDEKEQELMVQKLTDGIVELDDLVKELLSYSRIKHLNNQLQYESVAVRQIIEESIDKVASFYPDIRFEYKDNQETNVKVDDKLIQRALANILRNAGRFSKTLCQVTVMRSPDQITIHIEDDGHGIPPGKRERIFEPFTRLDPSRSRDSGGTGLGLAIVQSILEQHKGYVEVDDSDLGGACFSLTIPCTDT
jgi:two-component system sensor histidine kinase RstB